MSFDASIEQFLFVTFSIKTKEKLFKNNACYIFSIYSIFFGRGKKIFFKGSTVENFDSKNFGLI